MNEQIVSVGSVAGDLIKSAIKKQLSKPPKAPNPSMKERFLNPLSEIADQQGFTEVAEDIRGGPFKAAKKYGTEAYKAFMKRVEGESVSESSGGEIVTEMTPMWLADP